MPSERIDGKKLVRLVAPHPDGGGQDIVHCLEQDAHFICTACNSHDELCAALEAAIVAMEEAHVKDAGDYGGEIDQARAALAKVKGGA